MRVRQMIALVAGVLVLAVVNWNIVAREALIRNGHVVLLELAPVDPRSLMQGDYMALRFALENDLRRSSGRSGNGGVAVLLLDENGVARFSRFDDGSGLRENEIRLRYRVQGFRSGEVKIGTNAFFFEEGRAAEYETARYGEFRVDDQGEAILTQLRDAQRNVLGRSAVLE